MDEKRIREIVRETVREELKKEQKKEINKEQTQEQINIIEIKNNKEKKEWTFNLSKEVMMAVRDYEFSLDNIYELSTEEIVELCLRKYFGL